MSTTIRRFLTLALLSLIALVLAHQVIYLVETGSISSDVVRDGDGYWGSLELMVAMAAVALVATGSQQLLRLRRQARRVRLGGVVVAESGAMHLVRLFIPAWARVTLLTGLLFLTQENVERLAAGVPLPGLGVFAPDDFQLAWLVILAVSAAVALVTSLVHWRTLVLGARLRAATSARPRATSVRSVPRPLDWRVVAPLLARGLGRRAPPAVSAT